MSIPAIFFNQNASTSRNLGVKMLDFISIAIQSLFVFRGAIGICFFLLTSCGFHPRTAADVPPPLRVLYLDTPNDFSTFATALRNQLRAEKILLVPAPQLAAIHLHVFNIVYNHNNPSFLTANIASSFTYTLSLTAQLTAANGKPLSPLQSFSANNTVMLNTNQIYTPSIDNLNERELNREAVLLLYQWLISQKLISLHAN